MTVVPAVDDDCEEQVLGQRTKQQQQQQQHQQEEDKDVLNKHITAMIYITFNLICQSLSGFGIGMSTFIWIGTLGPLAMGACTLGNMFANITGFSLIYGCATALDSLCAQEFGAKRYSNIGLHTQRAILILTLFSLPTVLLWSHADVVLHNVLFIPKEIATHAGFWSRSQSAGLWPLIVFECLKKFMQARNIVWPAVLTTTIGLGFNLGMNYYVLRVLKRGFDGAAMIVPMQNWLHLCLYVLIIAVRKWVILWRRKRASTRHAPFPASSLPSLAGLSALSAFGKQGLQRSPLFAARTPRPSLRGPLYGKIEMTTPESSGEDTAADDADNADDAADADDSQNAEGRRDRPNENDLALTPTPSPAPTAPAPPRPLRTQEEDPENDWPPLSPAVFDEWEPFLRIGVPGALSLFIEWGSFELAASIAGQLGATGLAAHGINMSTSGLLYMIPLSVSSATTTIAGHMIGSGRHDGARTILCIGVAIDFVYGALAASLLMFVLRDRWAGVFTQDPPTQRLIFEVMPMMGLYTVVDATKCITLNILRSGGKPQITVYVNAFVCVGVMVPLGWYLSLRCHRGLSGLWFSMSVAWGLATLAFGYIIATMDLRELKVVA